MNRRQRRQYARAAPPRLCEFCGVQLQRVINVDSHIARHLEEKYGIDRHDGRRVARFEDGVSLPGSA